MRLHATALAVVGVCRARALVHVGELPITLARTSSLENTSYFSTKLEKQCDSVDCLLTGQTLKSTAVRTWRRQVDRCRARTAGTKRLCSSSRGSVFEREVCQATEILFYQSEITLTRFCHSASD
jgi:hypothetical protein